MDGRCLRQETHSRADQVGRQDQGPVFLDAVGGLISHRVLLCTTREGFHIHQMAHFIGVLPKRQSLLLLLSLLEQNSLPTVPFEVLSLLAESGSDWRELQSHLESCRQPILKRKVMTVEEFTGLTEGRLLPSKAQALALSDCLLPTRGAHSLQAQRPLPLPDIRCAITSLLTLLGNRWAWGIWSRLSDPLASALLLEERWPPEHALAAQFGLLAHCFLSRSLDYELTLRLLDPRRKPDEMVCLRVANGLMLADGLRNEPGAAAQ